MNARKITGTLILAAIILVPFGFVVAEHGWVGAIIRWVLYAVLALAMCAVAHFASHLIWGKPKKRKTAKPFVTLAVYDQDKDTPR
jgi:hypothetical protein